MSFHYNANYKSVDDLDYYKSVTSYLEDWQYRHLTWRVHKFSKVCPICLSVKVNREMLERLILTKSPSLAISDDDAQEEQQEPNDNTYITDDSEDVI